MIDLEVIFNIQSMLGLQKLTPMEWQSEIGMDGHSINQTQVKAYWMANVKHFHPSFPEDNLTIAIVTTTHWKRGIIFVPSQFMPGSQTDSEKRPVELTHWEDPVAIALQSVNPFPDETIEKPHTIQRSNVTLSYHTQHTHGTLYYDQPWLHNADFDKLWIALLNTVEHVVEVYDSNRLRKYIEPKIIIN